MKVSGSTIRSDLRVLVNKGKIQRQHGRVTRINELNLSINTNLPSFEKRPEITVDTNTMINENVYQESFLKGFCDAAIIRFFACVSTHLQVRLKPTSSYKTTQKSHRQN